MKNISSGCSIKRQKDWNMTQTNERARRLRALIGACAQAVMLVALLVPAAHADTKVRTVSFEYDPATGLLNKETVEPDVANNCLQTVTGYDTLATSKASAPRCARGPAAPSP